MSSTQIDKIRDRYIELLRDSLTMSLWDAADGTIVPGGISNPEMREEGKDWPRLAYTMTGVKRMKNLQFCVEDVLANDVPGDLIETGVWRGGSCIFMRGILEAYGVTDRRVWVADSFEGLPPPDEEKYPADAGANFHLFDEQLAVSIAEVEANFRRFGLLDDQVVMLKGYFKDTLPLAPIGELAVARLDGDLYESTMDSLTNLYPKLSVGGYLIIDDFGLPGCNQAVRDFRESNGITDPIEVIDWTGVFWKKTSGTDDPLDDEALSIRYTKLYSEYERLLGENIQQQHAIAALSRRISVSSDVLVAIGARTYVQAAKARAAIGGMLKNARVR